MRLLSAFYIYTSVKSSNNRFAWLILMAMTRHEYICGTYRLVIRHVLYNFQSSCIPLAFCTDKTIHMVGMAIRYQEQSGRVV